MMMAGFKDVFIFSFTIFLERALLVLKKKKKPVFHAWWTTTLDVWGMYAWMKVVLA